MPEINKAYTQSEIYKLFNVPEDYMKKHKEELQASFKVFSEVNKS